MRAPRARRRTPEDGSTWAVVAAGGTAGHVLPGICVGNEIVRRGAPRSAVHFVGSARGVETQLVPQAGFGLTVLTGRGLQRRLTLANIAAAAALFWALLQAVGLLRRHRPAVVVGLGGYASVACGVAAALLRVPLVIAEQNAVPGLANRLLSRFACVAATAFEATELRRAHWTGNPVRTDVLAVDRVGGRSAARAALGVQDQSRFVAVFGGSLGARRINDSVRAALGVWKDRRDLHILHISGPRDFAHLNDATVGNGPDGPAYELVAYREDMATVYAAADLVVSRAGATTVAELAAAGIPAVLVPLPGAPGDHQTANARRLADAGAAVIVHDGELDGARLAAEVDTLLSDPDRLAAMGRAGEAVARPDAAGSIVDLATRFARRPSPAPPEARP